MNTLDSELVARLAVLREQALYRQLRRVDSPQSRVIEMGGRSMLNFSSNDYLGLAAEPSLREAALRAVEKFGAGAGASRLISGSLAPHHELEEALSEFKGTEAALSFSAGFAAAMGTICALVGSEDVVILDKRVHASIVDAARLSRAKLRVFAHNDLDDLERILKWAVKHVGTAETPGTRRRRILVITESVFSMDGDHAPLREIVALKERHGAWLMLDEAHATGLHGKNRRGLAERDGVSDCVEIQMGTLGKAIGAAGGFIAGSRVLIDYLINHARSFIFSTAPVPAAAAAATAGVKFVSSPAGRERCESLWRLVRDPNLKSALPDSPPDSAILPIMLGDSSRALQIAEELRARGMFVPAIRYPTVARGKARLRLTITASHTAEDLKELADALTALSPGMAARSDQPHCA